MMEEQGKVDLSIYFSSEEHKYIFALCYLDKAIRMELLGITDEVYVDKDMAILLYEDKEKAKGWYHHIAKVIHPDTCKLPDCERAVAKLNELYAGMVKADE